jgi:ABC-2 type transport system ATP-binding protein
MWRFLRKINDDGTTIILTTHYLEEAESLCRHVAIIDEGRIIVDDRMSRVLRKLSVETLVFNLAEDLAEGLDVDGYEVRQVDPTTLEVDVASDRGVNDLFSALSDRGIRVISMRNKANRLEELFMRLVESKQQQNGGAMAAGG